MPGLTVQEKPQTATAAPEPKAEVNSEMLYPEFQVLVCAGDADIDQVRRKSITYDKMREILGCMTEAEYTAARIAANPKVTEKAARFPADGVVKLELEDGTKIVTEVAMTDENGDKVIFVRNAHNRPFKEARARRYAQEILTAGKDGRPNWRLNGEAFIIGQHGNVLSGQKRAGGFILAVQMWRKDPGKYPMWLREPVLDTVVSLGVEETPEVLRTLDNVDPRTDEDTLNTSGEFGGLGPIGRRECCRMLAKATDLVWDRTGFGRGSEAPYFTPSEAQGFRDRHPRLIKLVKHVWEENQDRAIAGGDAPINLSPGAVAGMAYLMAASASDGAKYRKGSPPREAAADFARLDKAKAFVSALVQQGDKEKKLKPSPLCEAVRSAILALKDPDTGAQARMAEKLIVMAKAWELFAQDKKTTAADLEVHMVERGEKTVIDPDQPDSFGGIDLGPKRPGELDGGSDDEAAAELAKAERRKEAEIESVAVVNEAPDQERQRRERIEANKAKLLKMRKAKADPQPAPAAKPKLKVKTKDKA